MEQGPELVDLSAGGLGLCEDSRQGGQGGAHAGVELSESAGELIGAVAFFNNSQCMVYYTDGSVVQDMAVQIADNPVRIVLGCEACPGASVPCFATRDTVALWLTALDSVV